MEQTALDIRRALHGHELVASRLERAAQGIRRDEERNVVRLAEMAEGLWYDDALISRIEQCILSEEEVEDKE